MRAQRAKSFVANTPKRWIAALVLVTLFFGVLPVMTLLSTLIPWEDGPRWVSLIWSIGWALFGFYIIGGVYRRARRAADREVNRRSER